MDIQGKDNYGLHNLNKINVILGKNGSGKSTLLRAIGDHAGAIPNAGNISYITPERSGVLNYEAGVEEALTNNPANIKNQRNTNQFSQFKQQTAAQFRKLRDLVWSAMEKHLKEARDGQPELFEETVEKLNSLLDEIKIVEFAPAFRFHSRSTDEPISPGLISSGESELTALGIETLVFVKELQADRTNILIFDEPDVHLHPDLQVRLMHFIRDLVDTNDFRVIVASHSTALLGALENYAHVNVGFMKAGEKTIALEGVNDIYKKILPVFGAHPLSNIFNEAPILLVEGEDDERIWQQAGRSSHGAIRVFPCVCGSVEEIHNYEQQVINVVNSIYDNAKAFSLRDGDGNVEGNLADEPPMVKLRLKCYSAENLLLSNEVLASLDSNWELLTEGMTTWIAEKTATGHIHLEKMVEFRDSNFDRRNHKIKEIRNDLMGIIGSDKPWEVAIGQTIAGLTHSDATDFHVEGSIFTFLGPKVTTNLLP